MNSTLIFNKNCFYHHNKMVIYFLPEKNNTNIKNIEYSKINNSSLMINTIIFKDKYKKVNIFYVKIRGCFSSFNQKRITITYIDNTQSKNIKLYFPFQYFTSRLPKNSIIVSTMCKDYNNRLTEWIKYNLKLQFDAVIIFNNGGIEENDYIRKYSSKKYSKLLIVDYPYNPLKNCHWRTIQGVSLCITSYVFKLYSKYIALIDADEFIYIPKENNIKKFLSNYNYSIMIQSNLITNKSNKDSIHNNILSLCKYIGKDKYTKLLIHSNDINHHNAFIYTPHKGINFKSIKLNKNLIIHYHAWVNKRLNYYQNMKKINFLEDFLYK